MSSILAKVILGGIGILALIGFLGSGGWWILVPLMIVWTLGLVLGREGIEAWKNSHVGRKSMRPRDARDLITGSKPGDDDNWGRK